MRHESTINLKAIKFFRKIDKVFDSLILRGGSFHRRQIRTKKEFLKMSVLLKETSSVKWSTFHAAHISALFHELLVVKVTPLG